MPSFKEKHTAQEAAYYKKLSLSLCFFPQLKYKEVYQRNKSNCTIKPDAVHIKAAKDAYKVNTNVSIRNFPRPNRDWSALQDMISFTPLQGTQL